MIEASLPLLQRWIGYLTVLVLVGVVAWIAWVRRGILSHLGPGLPPTEARSAIEGLTGRVERIGLGAALLLLFAWALALVVQVMAFRDPFVPLGEDVEFLLRNTSWGRVWLAQGSVAFVLFFSLLRLVRRRLPSVSAGEAPEGFGSVSAGWSLVAGLVLVLPVTQALSSHAMAETGLNRSLAVGADALHGLAAGAWIGSLSVILLAVRHSPRRLPLLAAQLRAFSSLALLAVSVLVGAGVVLSVFHLSAFRELWEAAYGRALLAKVLVAGVAIALGYRNWRHGLPRMDEAPPEAEKVRIQAAFEVGAAVTVLGLTALLTGLPTP